MAYVKHDDLLWRVVSDTQLDGRAAYFLERRIPIHEGGKVRGFRKDEIVAFVNECEAHDRPRKSPQRTLRDEKAVLVFDVATKVVKLRRVGERRTLNTTLDGLYRALCWQAALLKKIGKRKGSRKRK